MMYLLLDLFDGEVDAGCPVHLFTTREKAQEFLDARIPEESRFCYTIIEMLVDPEPCPSGPGLVMHMVSIGDDGSTDSRLLLHHTAAKPNEWIAKGGSGTAWVAHVMASSPEMAIAVVKERIAMGGQE